MKNENEKSSLGCQVRRRTEHAGKHRFPEDLFLCHTGRDDRIGRGGGICMWLEIKANRWYCVPSVFSACAYVCYVHAMIDLDSERTRN